MPVPIPDRGPAGPARWLSPCAAVALALATLAEHRALEAARAAAFAWLERAGVTLDTSALDREPDPDGVRLRAARAVLAAELDPARRQGISAGRAARETAARMAEAARAGREVLARRPASWEAALVAGGGHLPRLVAGARPAAVHRLPAVGGAARDGPAPGARQAGAGALPRRRLPGDLAGALAAQARDRPRPAGRGLPPVRRPRPPARPLARHRRRPREAFAVLPDDPAAWERVEKVYARRGDLAGLRGGPPAAGGVAARQAAAGPRGGGPPARRRPARRGAGALPLGGRAGAPRGPLPGPARAGPRALPAGPVDGATAARLAPHLARALDRCLFAACELPAGRPQAAVALRARPGAVPGGARLAVRRRPAAGEPLRAAHRGAGHRGLGALPDHQGAGARRPRQGGRGPRGAVAGPPLLAGEAPLLAGPGRGGARGRGHPRRRRGARRGSPGSPGGPGSPRTGPGAGAPPGWRC